GNTPEPAERPGRVLRIPPQPARLPRPAAHRLHRRQGRGRHRAEDPGEGRGRPPPPERGPAQLPRALHARGERQQRRQPGRVLADLRLLPVRSGRGAQDPRGHDVHEPGPRLPAEHPRRDRHLRHRRAACRRGGRWRREADGRHADRQDRGHRRAVAGDGDRAVHDPRAAPDRSGDRPHRVRRDDVRHRARPRAGIRSRRPHGRPAAAGGRLHQGSGAAGPGPLGPAGRQGPRPGCGPAGPGLLVQHHLRRRPADPGHRHGFHPGLLPGLHGRRRKPVL
ncbi:MAG: hypothetical protein AVDCRST_MAG24-835, partial [uncultured Nocardioidaceae bacterium]